MVISCDMRGSRRVRLPASLRSPAGDDCLVNTVHVYIPDNGCLPYAASGRKVTESRQDLPAAAIVLAQRGCGIEKFQCALCR
jgi:hypothetical protein